MPAEETMRRFAELKPEPTGGLWVDDDAATVCLTHRRFIPCRPGMYGPDGDKWCYITQDPRAVAIVQGWQRGEWDDTSHEKRQREVAEQHKGDVIPGSGRAVEPKDFQHD